MLPLPVTAKSRGQAVNLIIRRLCVVIEIRFDTDSFREYAGEMKSLSHHVNHFAISDEVKVMRIQVVRDLFWNTICYASDQGSPFF